MYWVGENGTEVDNLFAAEVTSDDHLVNVEGEEPEVDIVFNDKLTCYDFVSGNWYVRGDAEQLYALMDGLAFASDNGRWTVTLSEDGTFVDVYDGEESTGTWEFISSCNITLNYDLSYDPDTLDVERDADGQVLALSNTWNHLTVQ